MSQLTHAQVCNFMEAWAPKSLAYDWDNVGLQIGSLQDPTNKILITLDVTDAVVEEAILNDVNLIIAHHPLIFNKLSHINFDTFKGKVIKKLIQHNITVYVAHTNLDITIGGINDILCTVLGLQSTRNLVEFPNSEYGIGKVGYVEEEMTLKTLCNHVKSTFGMEYVRVIGDLHTPIKKVAVLGGSGEKFIGDAIRKKADVFITGDITYHAGQDALEMGLAIIDAGHYIEVEFIKPTKDYLVEKLNQYTVEVIESTINTDPFQFA